MKPDVPQKMKCFLPSYVSTSFSWRTALWHQVKMFITMFTKFHHLIHINAIFTGRDSSCSINLEKILGLKHTKWRVCLWSPTKIMRYNVAHTVTNQRTSQTLTTKQTVVLPCLWSWIFPVLEPTHGAVSSGSSRTPCMGKVEVNTQNTPYGWCSPLHILYDLMWLATHSCKPVLHMCT